MLHKSQQLIAVSRQNILQRCKELWDGQTVSFRGYREAAKAKNRLELRWTEQMKERLRHGSEEKMEMALKEERKKLNILDQLKACGGPFTSSEEVDIYLDDPDISCHMKQKRMKREVQYSRDTSRYSSTKSRPTV